MTVLVCGATGAQGGAVIRAAVTAGLPVRALVRNPGSEAALRLAAVGVELVRGDLEDAASLQAALAGTTAAFSVQLADYPGRNAERRQAANLIAAALDAGVRQVVHASVSGTGWRGSRPGSSAGDVYWDSKEAVETAMRGAGLEFFTLLKPAFMMDNLIAPKAARMFPDLPQGEILTAVAPDTPLALVATEDIGAAAVAAFHAPERFAGAEIELAGDVLTLAQTAQTIGAAAGRSVSARTLTPDALVERGQSPGWVETQQWLNEVGYPARPADMAAFGLAPTTLAGWAVAHRSELIAALKPQENR
jgi:uncharacterized protein YbjT (DUF2867 family)